ncbi:MAG: response regulator transcription factor [Chloroflexota bacterium]|nr:response regulator transcription factor [Chloroflexota bacterium]
MIRVLLVNEFQLMGNVIAAVLEDEPDIEVIGCVTTPQSALEKVANEDVDMVLVSTRLPNDGALRLTGTMTEEDSSLKVLALGVSEKKERVLQFAEAGASGYVRKDDSVDDLIKAIRSAHRDQAKVSPKVAAALMARVSELTDLLTMIESGMPEDYSELTPRELEILELIAKGYSNQKIADHLFIEVGTVKNHVHSILNKLDVRTREDAAAYLAIIKGQPLGDFIPK